jgi:hypothetical protein
MPWGDWQFWCVTIAAVLSVAALIRVLIPRRRTRQRTTLTIERAKIPR